MALRQSIKREMMTKKIENEIQRNNKRRHWIERIEGGEIAGKRTATNR